MSKCVVNGCQSRRKQFKNSHNQHISMHGFPKSKSTIKLWLQQTGQDFGDINAFAERVKEKNRYYRICSTHFSEDSYYTHGFQKLLKTDAVPTIFKNKVTSSEINKMREIKIVIMSRCVVNGCRTASKRQTNETYVSMHGFPKSTNGIKLWLQQTGQDFGDIDAYAERIKQKSSYYRMCSAHFSEDCYYMHGIRKLLKPDAIPTIFNNQATSGQSNATTTDLPSTSTVQTPEIQKSFLPVKVVKIENDGTYYEPGPYANIPSTSVTQLPLIHSANSQNYGNLPAAHTTASQSFNMQPASHSANSQNYSKLAAVHSASSPSYSKLPAVQPNFFPCNVVNFVRDGTYRPSPYGIFMDHGYMPQHQPLAAPSTPQCHHVGTNTPELRTQDRGTNVKPTFGVHSTKTQTFFPWNKKNVSTSTEDLVRKKDAYMWTGLTPTLVDCSTSTDDLLDFGTQLLLGASNSKQDLNHSYIDITIPEPSPAPASDVEDTDNSSEDSEIEAKQEARSLRKDPDYCPAEKEHVKEQSPLSDPDYSSGNDQQEKNHSYFTRKRNGPHSVPASDIDTENYSEVDSEMEITKDEQSAVTKPESLEIMDYPVKEQSPIKNPKNSPKATDVLKEQSSTKNQDCSQELTDFQLKEQPPINNPNCSIETMDKPLKEQSPVRDPKYSPDTVDYSFKERAQMKDPENIPKTTDYPFRELSLTKYPHYSPKATTNPFKILCPVNDPSKEELVHERKFIVFESCLDTLFSKLECSYDDQCNAHIVKFQKNVVDTLLIVYGECTNGHQSKLWQSQPMIGEIAIGNLLSSAALLFSGNQFTKISEMFSFFGVSFVSEKTFSICQKKILFPVIDLHWKRDRQSTISSLKCKPLSLSGDGHWGNPEFCTYALLEDTTKKIIDFSTVQVSEANSSMATESRAFQRCLNNVLNEGLQVHILATDLHVGIRKIMRNEHSDISHQFDVWNYSERIRKKLTSIAKRKPCKGIKPWIPAILNHLWASSSRCYGNVELMKETWSSILYHVSNTHVWDDGILINGCRHKELSKEECEIHPWVLKNTMAYSALEDLISNGQILTDMQHLTEYCHTAEIEMFHSMVLKYLPRKVQFKIDAIYARTKLAILAHNNNVNKPPVRIALVSESRGPTGCLRRKPYLPKSRERFQVEPVYECTFEYVLPMMADVLRVASGEISQIRHDLAQSMTHSLQPLAKSISENDITPFKRRRLEVCST